MSQALTLCWVPVREATKRLGRKGQSHSRKVSGRHRGSKGEERADAARRGDEPRKGTEEKHSTSGLRGHSQGCLPSPGDGV